MQETADGDFRVVGLDVEPWSLEKINTPKLADHSQPKQYLVAGEPIIFSYQIKTVKTTGLTWYSRYDHYIKMGNNQVHYLQLILSFSIVLGLGLVVGMIFRKLVATDLENIALTKIEQQNLR